MRRFTPIVAEAGSPVSVRVEIRNLGNAWTGEATWRDEFPWHPFATPSVRLAPLSRYSGLKGVTNRTSVEYGLTPPRRGLFDIGPLVVGVGDPYGLSKGEIVVGERQKLVVTPRVVRLAERGISPSAEDGISRTLRRRSMGGEVDLMTREYRHGDSLRRVHWKASAHRGEIMVREEEQRSHARARILLETRRSGYRDAAELTVAHDQSDSFEWAVAFCASLALHLQNSGFDTEILESSFGQLASPEPLDAFLESFANVRLVENPVHGGGFVLPKAEGRTQGSVFAIVADADPRTVELLAARRSQFDAAVVFVINPHNDVVLHPLRRAGWICVSVDPTADLSMVWLASLSQREADRVDG